RSDGKQTLAPERLDERHVDPGEIAHVTETAFDFVMHHGLGAESLRVRGRDTDGRLAFGGNSGSQLLVEQPRKDHNGGVAGLFIGDAQTSDELTVDAHPLERSRKQAAAAVDDENLVAFARQLGHLMCERTNYGIVFEQSSSEFDYCSHCSAV